MKYNHFLQKQEYIKIMVELLLPKNSKVKRGKKYKSDGQGLDKKTFFIYRFDPEKKKTLA